MSGIGQFTGKAVITGTSVCGPMGGDTMTDSVVANNIAASHELAPSSQDSPRTIPSLCGGTDSPTPSSNGDTGDAFSTSITGNTPVLKRKAGRPSNSDALRFRERCGSEGNIKDFLKRKRLEADQYLWDNALDDSPFKRSNLLRYSPGS